MSNLIIALEITALGMGLVFAAIILLWWMMSLLTSITADQEQISAQDSISSVPEAAPLKDRDRQAKAAAVAVAVALAEQQACLAHPLADSPTAVVSAWQLGTRTRQLYEKRAPLIRKPRNIG